MLYGLKTWSLLKKLPEADRLPPINKDKGSGGRLAPPVDSLLDGAQGKGAKVKFEFFGQAIIEQTVKPAGTSGRVYLPTTWAGHNVKIVRID